MKIRTNMKAGAMTNNRCEALRIRTGVKAGMGSNRCEALRIRTGIKADAQGTIKKLVTE